MPYKKPRRKAELDAGKAPVDTGDLTYLFFKLAVRYITLHGVSYEVLASVVAALENTKLEFYRRHVAPYEDEKIRENGDVTA